MSWKKFKMFCLIGIASFGVLGCSEDYITVNVNIPNEVAGAHRLKYINSGLYYDCLTQIVYEVGTRENRDELNISVAPYYSLDGKLYKYNPEEHEFEEMN